MARQPRAWAGTVARFGTAALAVYLQVTSNVLVGDDRRMFGIIGSDVRPVYLIASAVGLATAAVGGRRLWTAWAVVITVCSFGRGMTLLIVGSPELRRAKELQGVFAWELHWLLGVLCTMVSLAAIELQDGLRRHRRLP